MIITGFSASWRNLYARIGQSSFEPVYNAKFKIQFFLDGQLVKTIEHEGAEFGRGIEPPIEANSVIIYSWNVTQDSVYMEFVSIESNTKINVLIPRAELQWVLTDYVLNNTSTQEKQLYFLKYGSVPEPVLIIPTSSQTLDFTQSELTPAQIQDMQRILDTLNQLSSQRSHVLPEVQSLLPTASQSQAIPEEKIQSAKLINIGLLIGIAIGIVFALKKKKHVYK